MTLMAHTGMTDLMTREQLAEILPPEATDTHKPIAHSLLVNSILESLSFRHINVVHDEYAVSNDGMKLFGAMDLETMGDGFRFSLGLRNANDRSMRFRTRSRGSHPRLRQPRVSRGLRACSRQTFKAFRLE